MQTTTAHPTMIPLNKLHPSPFNVRKTSVAGVDELAANILAAKRVIQNLVVVPDTSGKKSGFGVVAGGRRLAALAAKSEAIPADWPIPCQIVGADEAAELSLSENVHREAMHPADEYIAWAALVDGGMGIEDVAARHGTSADTVHKRLSLARVSPQVMALYRAGDLQLDQVMAFTLTDDHAAQDAVLASDGDPSVWTIRRALTGEAVRSNDARAVFVGEVAYLAAGGHIRRDMFSDDTYFEDGGLLTRLVRERLDAVAAPLRDAAAWVDVHAEVLTYQTRGLYCAAPTVQGEPDAATANTLAVLEDKHAKALAILRKIEDAPASDDADADDAAWSVASDRVEGIEDDITAAHDRLAVIAPEAKALAGAVVALDHTGEVVMLQQVIRTCDKGKVRSTATGQADHSEAKASGDPQSVKTDLSAYLTAVGQNALAENVPVALRALAYQLALGLIRARFESHGVEVSAVDHARLDGSRTLEGSEAETQRNARHDAWDAALPADADALWRWCLAADDTTIQALLAFITARSLNGTHCAARMAPLLAALGVAPVAHWSPRPDYFARLKKQTTLQILADNGHTDPSFAKLKRDALAARAAALLADSGWLPPTLAL